MSRCDLELSPVDLESLWYIVCHVVIVLLNLSEIEQSAAELLTILHIFTVQCLMVAQIPEQF